MSSDRTIRLLFNKKYPKEFVADFFKDAQSQLINNFEDHVEDDVASYLAISFGANIDTLLKRFDLYPEVKADDDFVWDSISEEADSELKMLKKFRPEYFDDRFNYGFNWHEGEFGIFVYLTREEYEDINKKSNPVEHGSNYNDSGLNYDFFQVFTPYIVLKNILDHHNGIDVNLLHQKVLNTKLPKHITSDEFKHYYRQSRFNNDLGFLIGRGKFEKDKYPVGKKEKGVYYIQNKNQAIKWMTDMLILVETFMKELNIMKTSNPKYEPMFLSWCKSYEEEVKEFEDLINSKPQDEKQLREEYEELTGKKYKKPSKSKGKFLKLRLVKNPNGKEFSPSSYITKRFGLFEKIEKLVDNGFEVYSDSYRSNISAKEFNLSVLSDPDAFITSDLFRYTDYGGAHTVAKANIRYIEENYEDLIDEELIQIYDTAHNGENLEFKFRALENDELYEELLGLDGYAVLSDDTLSEVESEIEQECWDSYGRDEFRQAIDEKFEGELELSDDELDTLAYEAAQYTSQGMGYTEAMDFVFDIDGLIEALDKVMDEDKVKQIKKENPSWVKDEELWEKAKKQSLKSYGKISYPFVVYIYKQMGGKIKKGKK